jgi:hypothetical protein
MGSSIIIAGATIWLYRGSLDAGEVVAGSSLF